MNPNEELKDPKYAKAYSKSKLIEKIIKVAKKVGTKFIYVVLLLFYSLQQRSTPKWAKSIIIGALGYFILPSDLINDLIPGYGHFDDWAVILAAVSTVAFYIERESIDSAKEKLALWFGAVDHRELQEIDQRIDKKKAEQQSIGPIDANMIKLAINNRPMNAQNLAILKDKIMFVVLFISCQNFVEKLKGGNTMKFWEMVLAVIVAMLILSIMQ